MRFVLVIAALLLTVQVFSATPDVFIPLLPEQREQLLALFRRFSRRWSSAVTDHTVLQSRRGKSRRKKWMRRHKRRADENTLVSGEHEQFKLFSSGMHEPNFLSCQMEGTKYKGQLCIHEFHEQAHCLPLIRRNKRSRSRNALYKHRKNICKNKKKNNNLCNIECLKTSLIDRVRKGFMQKKLVDNYGMNLCYQNQDGQYSDSSLEIKNQRIGDRNSIMTPDTFSEISNYNNKQKNNRVVETDRTGKISRKKYKCQHSNKKYLETLPCLEYHDLPKVNSETSTNIGQPYRNRNHQELCDDTHSRLPHRVDSLLTSTNPITSWDPPKKDEYERISKSISLKSIYDFLKQGIRVYNSVMDYIKRGWPFVYR